MQLGSTWKMKRMEISCIINDFARWTLSLSFINGVTPFDILLSQLPFLIFPLSLLCVLWHLIPVCNVFSSHPHPSLLIPYNPSILVPLFLPCTLELYSVTFTNHVLSLRSRTWIILCTATCSFRVTCLFYSFGGPVLYPRDRFNVPR